MIEVCTASVQTGVKVADLSSPSPSPSPLCFNMSITHFALLEDGSDLPANKIRVGMKLATHSDSFTSGVVTSVRRVVYGSIGGKSGAMFASPVTWHGTVVTSAGMVLSSYSAGEERREKEQVVQHQLVHRLYLPARLYWSAQHMLRQLGWLSPVSFHEQLDGLAPYSYFLIAIGDFLKNTGVVQTLPPAAAGAGPATNNKQPGSSLVQVLSQLLPVSLPSLLFPSLSQLLPSVFVDAAAVVTPASPRFHSLTVSPVDEYYTNEQQQQSFAAQWQPNVSNTHTQTTKCTTPDHHPICGKWLLILVYLCFGDKVLQTNYNVYCMCHSDCFVHSYEFLASPWLHVSAFCPCFCFHVY